jgi:hypothetical protein
LLAVFNKEKDSLFLQHCIWNQEQHWEKQLKLTLRLNIDAPLRTKAIQVPDISFFVMEVAPLATERDGTAME